MEDRPEDAELTAVVPVSAAEGLTVRARRAGDRMADGPKVQDVLTDAKIPARQRARVPVIATATGEIAWIPGIARAWNGVSDGYVLVAHAPEAWEMPGRKARSRVASSYMGREGL